MNKIKKFSKLFLRSFYCIFAHLYCSKITSKDAGTTTAYASARNWEDKISSSSISFLENLQRPGYVLPSVVTITVIETKTIQVHEFNFPFDFFGWSLG